MMPWSRLTRTGLPEALSQVTLLLSEDVGTGTQLWRGDTGVHVSDMT